MTRIETELNVPLPKNLIFVNLYEQVSWFLKGVLAADFSSSNDFVIQLPIFQGSFVMMVNFYYSGLLYVNPNANLTALIHNDFGRNAELSINVSHVQIPNWEVYAHFGSQTTYSGNLSSVGRYEIANILSVHSPLLHYAELSTNTTLATSIIELHPLWRDLILDGYNGEDLTGRYDIGSSVSLSNISPVVSDSIVKNVLKLERKYKDVEKKTRTLFCEDFIYDTMRRVFPTPNGCVDPIHIIEGILLHPDIHIYVLNTTYQPRTSI